MKTAVVAGATGLAGKQLLEKLLASGRYTRVVALTRSPLAGNHEKLTNIITGFDDLEDSINRLHPDDVFCCLGTTMAKAGSKEKFYEVDFRYPLNLAMATLGRGANQFLLVSALGANKRASIFYNRVKGEVEEAITKTGFKTVHIFRPSLLLGPRPEKRPGEDAAKTLYKIFNFAIPQKYKAISGERVADFMIEMAARDMKGVFVHESQDMQSQ
jgi:uncharacterized protein YbjT (DUF2867 family)